MPVSVEGWQPCSDSSLLRGDPLGGTAGFGERWFLVEIDGAWGAHAILQSRMDGALAARLVARVEKAGIRPLAIRRTGRRADERRAQTVWRWALVDSRPGRESVLWGQVDAPEALLDVPLDGSVGELSNEPVLCVCTHARHDQCCAVKGRPIVQALASEHPELTWECSHLGGDRFAATMVVLPEGLLYGRVPGADAPGLVTRYAAGLVDARFLRGRTALSNVAQAAEGFARARTGDERITAFRVVSESATDDGWMVTLDHDGAIVTVELGSALSEPLLSTCNATLSMRVREFVLRSIELAPRGGGGGGGGARAQEKSP
ncbi:sucrase ferredoxin [Diaminobutyricibacter sp. McL0618]|uniref:sucrase ferredoxin n=1 Tax=Leifsonia sp. McL0618 TaxID=3415677 RepID=UPI003CEDF7B1